MLVYLENSTNIRLCEYPETWIYSTASPASYQNVIWIISYPLGILAASLAITGFFWNFTLLIVIAQSTHIQQHKTRTLKTGRLNLINKLIINIIVADLVYCIALCFTSSHLLFSGWYHYDYSDVNSTSGETRPLIEQFPCIASSIHTLIYYSLQATSIFCTLSISFVRWMSVITLPKVKSKNVFNKIGRSVKSMSVVLNNPENNNSLGRSDSTNSKNWNVDSNTKNEWTTPAKSTNLAFKMPDQPKYHGRRRRSSKAESLSKISQKIKSKSKNVMDTPLHIKIMAGILISISWIFPFVLLLPLVSENGFDLDHQPDMRGFTYLPSEKFSSFGMYKKMHIDYSLACRILLQLLPIVFMMIFYSIIYYRTLATLNHSEEKMIYHKMQTIPLPNFEEWMEKDEKTASKKPSVKSLPSSQTTSLVMSPRKSEPLVGNEIHRPPKKSESSVSYQYNNEWSKPKSQSNIWKIDEDILNLYQHLNPRHSGRRASIVTTMVKNKSQSHEEQQIKRDSRFIRQATYRKQSLDLIHEKQPTPDFIETTNSYRASLRYKSRKSLSLNKETLNHFKDFKRNHISSFQQYDSSESSLEDLAGEDNYFGTDIDRVIKSVGRQYNYNNEKEKTLNLGLFHQLSFGHFMSRDPQYNYPVSKSSLPNDTTSKTTSLFTSRKNSKLQFNINTTNMDSLPDYITRQVNLSKKELGSDDSNLYDRRKSAPFAYNSKKRERIRASSFVENEQALDNLELMKQNLIKISQNRKTGMVRSSVPSSPNPRNLKDKSSKLIPERSTSVLRPPRSSVVYKDNPTPAAKEEYDAIIEVRGPSIVEDKADSYIFRRSTPCSDYLKAFEEPKSKVNAIIRSRCVSDQRTVKSAVNTARPSYDVQSQIERRSLQESSHLHSAESKDVDEIEFEDKIRLSKSRSPSMLKTLKRMSSRMKDSVAGYQQSCDRFRLKNFRPRLEPTEIRILISVGNYIG